MSESKKKKWDDLKKPFAKSVVKKNPAGFGDYVPHHIYTRRLVESGLFDSFDTVEVIKGQAGHVIGARCTLVVDGKSVTHVGDVEPSAINQFLNGKKSEGELIKDAESDALKRCCMRLGIGLELWEQDMSEEEYNVSAAPVQEEPKKKVAQETGTPHSKPRITVNQLKEMVLVSCNDDKNFAARCYKDCYNRAVIKTKKDDITKWEDADIKTFLDLVDSYIDKNKETFEERKNNEPVVNRIIENLDNVTEITDKEKDMDFSNDDWKAGKEADPMTEAQKGFLEGLINQAIDKGLDALAAEAKQYLNSDNTGKVSCSDWINKLKNAL